MNGREGKEASLEDILNLDKTEKWEGSKFGKYKNLGEREEGKGSKLIHFSFKQKTQS